VPEAGSAHVDRAPGRLRIGFVAQPIDVLHPPVEGGSLAIWLYQVAKRCAQRGHETFVFANHGSTLRSTSVTSDGVRYIYTPTGPNSLLNRLGHGAAALRRRWGRRGPAAPEFGASWRDAGYAISAGRASRRLRCDVVHVMNYSQLAPVIRRMNPGCRIILHMGCEWLTQLDRSAIEDRLASVDLVVGCSDHITGAIAERFPALADRCVTVPNAVDVVPEHDRGMTDPQRILFVGRVSPEKGLHVLVQAFHRVLERSPAARLHIAGGVGSAPLEYLVGLSDDPRVAALAAFYPDEANGPRDHYAQWLAQAAGPELGKRIHFDGRVDHSEIGECYKRAAVLVNPSLSEAFGMSLVEAMMHGLPVVASRVGGMTGIVEHGRTGLLVEPGDAEALAAALCELLADPARQHAMGDAGRRLALEKYTWDTATDLLLARFRALPAR
jgi:glycosyltransferase involved in cell wall biosynthesis